MTKEEAQKKIDEVVELLKPIVEKIESSPATTKDHYGNYAAILGTAAPGTKEKLAACLIKAGANQNGVAWALKLT